MFQNKSFASTGKLYVLSVLKTNGGMKKLRGIKMLIPQDLTLPNVTIQTLVDANKLKLPTQIYFKKRNFEGVITPNGQVILSNTALQDTTPHV